MIIGIPLSINAIGILSGNTSFYYITIFPFVIVFLLPTIFLNLTKGCIFKHRLRFELICKICIMMVTILLGGTWAIQDNVVYQKADIVKKQLTTAGTILGMQIQSVESFNISSPVVFVGETPYPFLVNMDTSTDFSFFLTNNMGIFGTSETIYSSEILVEYMRQQLGLNYNYLDQEIMNNYKEEVERMPIYPNSGSVSVFDGMIVIKLGDCSN